MPEFNLRLCGISPPYPQGDLNIPAARQNGRGMATKMTRWHAHDHRNDENGRRVLAAFKPFWERPGPAREEKLTRMAPE